MKAFRAMVPHPVHCLFGAAGAGGGAREQRRSWPPSAVRTGANSGTRRARLDRNRVNLDQPRLTHRIAGPGPANSAALKLAGTQL